MRLLVISDTHGRASLIERVLSRETEATDVFFLGDVVSDIDEVKPLHPERRFHIVRGNCDYFCDYPLFDVVEFKEPRVTVYMTHGHKHFVKSGIDDILDTAKNLGANIALYGHTHISAIEYRDGIYIINSGSLALPRNGAASYAVIDITPAGILPAIKKV
ncbi:MAG: YfcE family phosphodiesterase [Clostridia bacterium]|nr:YfcE family phosphodiesterase [Clostridia bacterium]